MRRSEWQTLTYRLREIRIETLRQEIAIGIEQSDRGEVFDGEEVIQELLGEIDHGNTPQKYIKIAELPE